jgi:uncharacterized Fe-S cluster protein YjdI
VNTTDMSIEHQAEQLELDVEKIKQSFNKIGFVSHETDDEFLHALLIMAGIQTEPRYYDLEIVKSYVADQQQWYKRNSYEGMESIQGNRFKILSTIIGSPKKTKKMNRDQLQNHRKNLIDKFTIIEPLSIIENVHLLAKLNGRFFPINTVLKEGKITYINRATVTFNKADNPSIIPDKFSVDKLIQYIEHQQICTYGTKEWCSSGLKCRIAESKANTSKCKKCNKLTHQECMHLTNCVACEPNVKWNSDKAKWISTSDNANTENQKLNSQESNCDQPQNIPIKRATKNNRVTICPTNFQLQEIGRRRHGMTLSRLDIRVHMQPIADENGDTKQLRRQLQEIVDKLRNIDPSISIFPWFDDADSQSMPNHIVPNDQRGINKYFARIQPVKQGMAFGELQIKHEKNGKILFTT